LETSTIIIGKGRNVQTRILIKKINQPIARKEKLIPIKRLKQPDKNNITKFPKY
jgi:hypothetical protein